LGKVCVLRGSDPFGWASSCLVLVLGVICVVLFEQRARLVSG
jgi:hypothetical protein